MRTPLALLLALLTAVPAADAAAQSATDRPVVTLAEPGAEPRRALRYQLGDITPQDMRMDMTTEITMDMGFGPIEQAMPTMRMIMSVDRAALNDAGHLEMHYALGDVTILETPGVEPAMQAALEQAMGQLGTLAGTTTIDDRGFVIDGALDLSGADPAVAASMQGFDSAMSQMTAPFPEEPVGVGARWTVATSMDLNGMSIQQSAEYVINQMTDTSVTVGVTIEQSASAQPIDDPSIPEGMSAQLTEFTGSGTGLSTIYLDRIVPDSTATVQTAVTIAVDAGAMGTQTSSTQQSMRIEISPNTP